MDLTELK